MLCLTAALAWRGAPSGGTTWRGAPAGSAACRSRSVCASGAEPTLTQRLLTSIPPEAETGGAGGQSTYESLVRLDAAWSALRSGASTRPPRQIVFDEPTADATPEYDVLVVGGNIGILFAAALAARGFKACVLEAGKLAGRAQDWNASRREVEELVAHGIISQSDLDDIIGIEFNPMRCAFEGGDDVWLNDVLNVGVRPAELISRARQKFEAAGGVVIENSPLERVGVRRDAAVATTRDGETVSARLILDCMGQRSPIVAQIRNGAAPDGVCAVVGTCASGYDPSANTFGDVIYGDGDIAEIFWEAFPASASPEQRTTYLFTYMDLDPARPSIEELFEEYWRRLPAYQGVPLRRLTFRRALFGLFTSYKDSPLAPGFDRVMQVGDASGVQSPLSFGGFGALTRHVGRITSGVVDALGADMLTRSDLGAMATYQPNLRAAWLFQASMRPPVRGGWASDFISRVLVSTFDVMADAGDAVMRPFLQDVLRADSLAVTIGGLMISHPIVALSILGRLGPAPILDWGVHYAAMCWYSAVASPPARAALTSYASSIQESDPSAAYEIRRRLDGWTYGAGLDFGAGGAVSAAPIDADQLGRAKTAVAAARAFVGDVSDRTLGEYIRELDTKNVGVSAES